MADRYRKSSKDRVAINCKITAEAKAYLNQLAGEFAIGHAIEQLVEEHRKSRQPVSRDRWNFIRDTSPKTASK